MALVRFNEMDAIPGSFSTMLDRFFEDAVKTKDGNFRPQVDVSETEDQYEIAVSVPGLKKEEFNVEVQQNSLVISGERKFVRQENKKHHVVESHYGSFYRMFTLPDDIKADSIDASYEGGILNIAIPKDKEKTATKQIKVK
ncbi:MAG: Hsp20/alpha crystallin family protein [Bacteroidia bacterium]